MHPGVPPVIIIEVSTTQEAAMQFGLFSVGDVTMDPTTGRTPS